MDSGSIFCTCLHIRMSIAEIVSMQVNKTTFVITNVYFMGHQQQNQSTTLTNSDRKKFCKNRKCKISFHFISSYSMTIQLVNLH